MEHIINVFGSFDENLRLIEAEMNVKITDRDSEIKISVSYTHLDVYKRQGYPRPGA